MIDLHEKIREFCKDEEEITKTLAFIKVGSERRHEPRHITSRMMADVLFRFLKVPPIPGKS